MRERVGVSIHADRITIGERFGVRFMRTLRIPDDGGEYPLPPGLGTFPLRRVSDYRDRVPEAWREHGGVFLPMYQREAMWLGFTGAWWKPTAVKVAVGKLNALSGAPWQQRMDFDGDDRQDYMVVPDQPWLDGINAGRGVIRQFVAMPLGMGYTVEGQVTGEERFGGLQIISFEPKRGRFPDAPPRPDVRLRGTNGEMYGLTAPAPAAACPPPQASPAVMARRAGGPAGGTEMGLAAGGRMRQQIYPDRHGVATWDEHRFGRVYVHIVNSQMWREITGEPPPETPVSARSYAESGLPWFELYDEEKGDIAPSEQLANVKSVTEFDAEKGFASQQDDDSVVAEPVITYGVPSKDAVADGTW
jgi:hypothetical protein